MSKPMSRRYSGSAIPIELLRPIFQALPQGELFRICALSHTFHEEVAWVLYRHVDLANSTLEQCTSWARQIVTRCDLAQLTLALSLPGYLHKEDDGFGGLVLFLTEWLPKAMRAMANLTSLALEQHDRRPIFLSRKRGSFLNARPFMGCSFRLKTFRGEINLPDSDISPFLHEQNQIQDLEIARCYNLTPPPGSTPASLLPHLSVISIGYNPPQNRSLFTVIALQPLTRLRVCGFASFSLGAIADIILTLAPARTLTHFDLDFDHIRDFTVPVENYYVEAFTIIARGLPQLKFLRFSRRMASNPSPWEWLDLPRALSAFEGLETLMLHVRYGAGAGKEARGFVQRCMMSCPTLRCLTITGRVLSRSDTVPPHIAFIRAPGSDYIIQIGSHKALDKSAWRDT